MKINEIISESQQSLWGDDEPWPIDGNGKVKSYGKLNQFRSVHRGLNIPAIGDDSQEIDLDVKTRNSRSDSEHPFTGYTTTGLIGKQGPITIRQKAQDFINLVKHQCENPSTRAENNGNVYELILAQSQPQYAAFGIRTKTNDIMIRFSLGSGIGLPRSFRIINPTDTESKERMQEDAMEILKPFTKKIVEEPVLESSQTSISFIPTASAAERIAVFWKIVDAVEAMGPDFVKKENRTSGAGSKIKQKQTPIRYYWKLASNLYDSIKAGTKWAVSRGGEGSGYDAADELIIIGITPGGQAQIKAGRKAYREHVVPCDLINDMGIDIAYAHPKWKTTQKDEVIRKLISLIQRNLAIVLCSSPPKDAKGKFIKDPNNKTEQEILDEKYKTTMPGDWEDGDDILQRFITCGIPVRSIKNNDTKGKRIAE